MPPPEVGVLEGFFVLFDSDAFESVLGSDDDFVFGSDESDLAESDESDFDSFVSF